MISVLHFYTSVLIKLSLNMLNVNLGSKCNSTSINLVHLNYATKYDRCYVQLVL